MTGSLVLVATPIGNLGDLSTRAVETLRSVDVIACEDTRHTRKLLTHFSISGPSVVAVHEHNESSAAQQLVERMQGGEVVALVTDAGMPSVSDPGQRVVAAAVEAGMSVTVVPGASAVLAALAVSGLPSDRFAFEGFPARKVGERRAAFGALAQDMRTTVFFESPQRVAQTVADLAEVLGAQRPAALVRELTKIHEEVLRLPLGELASTLADRTIKGECVVVVAGAEPVPATVTDEDIQTALNRSDAAQMSKRDLAAVVAEELAVSRRRVYEIVIRSR